MFYWHYQLVLRLYLHQPESHQLIVKSVAQSVSQFERTGRIDRTPGTPGHDKKEEEKEEVSAAAEQRPARNVILELCGRQQKMA